MKKERDTFDDCRTTCFEWNCCPLVFSRVLFSLENENKSSIMPCLHPRILSSFKTNQGASDGCPHYNNRVKGKDGVAILSSFPLYCAFCLEKWLIASRFHNFIFMLGRQKRLKYTWFQMKTVLVRFFSSSNFDNNVLLNWLMAIWFVSSHDVKELNELQLYYIIVWLCCLRLMNISYLDGIMIFIWLFRFISHKIVAAPFRHSYACL